MDVNADFHWLIREVYNRLGLEPGGREVSAGVAEDGRAMLVLDSRRYVRDHQRVLASWDEGGTVLMAELREDGTLASPR